MVLINSERYDQFKKRIPDLKALVQDIQGDTESDDRRLDTLFEELEKLDQLIIRTCDER